MQDFIICGFATKDTPYEQVAENYLIASCKKLNLELDFSLVPNLHSWKANTSFKGTFAKEMLNKHNRNVVLLDADAEITQYPKIFSLIPEDCNIAAHYLDQNAWYKNNSNRKEFLSGSLFLRNNNFTKEIVDKWILALKNNTSLWEQRVLENIIIENKVKVFELPLEYCYIREVKTGIAPHVLCNNPIIIHNQVSRKLKRTIC
jgi:hypothetical protein